METRSGAYHECMQFTERREEASVDGQEFEDKLRQLLKQDFSIGTEAFRDKLLARCLEMLGSDDDPVADETFDQRELSDAALDLLAAAGDASMLASARLFEDNEA